MRKIKIRSITIFCLTLLLSNTTPVFADMQSWNSCGAEGIFLVESNIKDSINESDIDSLKFTVTGLVPGQKYNFKVYSEENKFGDPSTDPVTIRVPTGETTASLTFNQDLAIRNTSTWLNSGDYTKKYITISDPAWKGDITGICILWTYNVYGSVNGNGCSVSWSQNDHQNSACLEVTNPLHITVTNATKDGAIYQGKIIVIADKQSGTRRDKTTTTDASGNAEIDLTINDPGQYNILVKSADGYNALLCRAGRGFPLRGQGLCTEEDHKRSIGSESVPAQFNLCQNVVGDDKECRECIGVYTALGCFEKDINQFIKSFLTLAIGIAGGIALLLILYGSIIISASSGNPETVQKGQQIVSSAIAGLLFIIFSVVILQIIGVEILQLPGF